MTNDKVLTVTLNEQTYSLNRSKFREWVMLESIKENIKETAEHRDVKAFSDAIYSYVSLFMGVEIDELDLLPWFDVGYVYLECMAFNQPTLDLPLFMNKYEKHDDVPWDYKERNWYYFVHKLAANYGWSMEQIGELEIDDAFALSQEIASDEQLQREWEYSLSEIAYPYDQASKKSTYKPLQRPFWMMGMKVEGDLKTTKILKSMIPVGNVIKAKRNENIVH